MAEWRLKAEQVEKREAERREAEAKRHKDDVAYMDSYIKQLKAQLEGLLAPAKKVAGVPAAGQPATVAA